MDSQLKTIRDNIIKLMKKLGINESCSSITPSRINKIFLETFVFEVNNLLDSAEIEDARIEQASLDTVFSSSMDAFGFDILSKPCYPEIVYINDGSAHFHVENGHINEAECMEVLKGYSKDINLRLRKDKALSNNLNAMYLNLSVQASVALLKQMNLYDASSNIHTIVTEHEDRKQLRTLVFRYIILSRIKNSNSQAYIDHTVALANSLGLDYQNIYDEYMTSIGKPYVRKVTE